MQIFESIKAVMVGMWTTFSSVFEKPVTYQYPEVKRPVRNRYRGRHVLQRYDNGLERCIGCSLCSAACPADAIFVESAENTDEKRFSPGGDLRQRNAVGAFERRRKTDPADSGARYVYPFGAPDAGPNGLGKTTTIGGETKK